MALKVHIRRMDWKLRLIFLQEENKMIDINAPIIPYVGMGGLRLYSKLESMRSILDQENVRSQILNDTWIRYDIGDFLELFFHLGNKKLFKITTLDGYKGKLFNMIFVGMKEKEFSKIEPTFIYDEFEEVFESEKGVFIETDAIEHTARWISIFVKELDTEDFDKGNW